MNCTKTEFTLFGNQVQLRKCITKHIVVNDEDIKAESSFKYLGVTLDPNLSLEPFIRDKCKKCHFQLKNIRDIRRFLSRRSCEQLVNSLITSTLDYGNGVLANLPSATLHPLQRVQNQSAKLILQRGRYDSSTEARRELHWLPVNERVTFKTLCLAYHCTHNEAPEYLRKMFVKNETKSYNLRKETNVYLVPKSKCRSFGDRAFEVNGPRLWNTLPPALQSINDFKMFKKELKTYIFRKVYL